MARGKIEVLFTNEQRVRSTYICLQTKNTHRVNPIAPSFHPQSKTGQCHISTLFAEIIFYLQRLHSYRVYIIYSQVEHTIEFLSSRRPFVFIIILLIPYVL